MAYITKTLTADEVIISQNKFHWWFLAKEIFYFLLLLMPALYFAYIPSGNVPSVGGLSSDTHYIISLVLMFCSLWPGARLVYGWVIKVTTEQALTNKRVFLKTGFIRRNTDELTKAKVETISINQSILGRILNFGEIEFTGTGGIKIMFTYVSNPTKVKKQFE